MEPENMYRVIMEQYFANYIPAPRHSTHHTEEKVRVVHDSSGPSYNYNNNGTGLAIGLAIGSMFNYGQ